MLTGENGVELKYAITIATFMEKKRKEKKQHESSHLTSMLGNVF